MSYDHSELREFLRGRSVLITGGTGSLGTRLVHILLDEFDVRRVVVFARGEFNHGQLRGSLPPEHQSRLRSFIGDVRDRERLDTAMRGVDCVIHAAAQKQVPLAEYNPFECIRTNVIGAENVVQAAIANGVQRVAALSTDKAVNPINLYGASKLASDKIFVAGNSMSGDRGTRFCVVRYGNVIGSKGSVIPFFKKLLAEGATDLPLTDERMTRFWITLEQAARFVLSCLGNMQGGDIFVPKIPSARITDLAEAVAPGVPTRVIGIRPGEKLHEMMVTEHDAGDTVDLGDRYVIEPQWNFWPRTSYLDQGHPAVPEDFVYSSDSNSHWLSLDEIKTLLATPGVLPGTK